MRHPHYDFILEWLEDTSAPVQYRSKVDGKWEDRTIESPNAFRPDYEYRFKPEPKPDVVRYCVLVDVMGDIKQRHYHNAKVIFDGETGKLKSAEVIV